MTTEYKHAQTFDVAIGGETFRVDAYGWRSAATAARKRYGDRTGLVAPVVKRQDVCRLPKGRRSA
jgi:hypothetical protein